MALGKINAMANISDQTKKQRDQFAGEDGILGANRSSANLFSAMLVNAESGEISIGEEIVNELAESTHTELYSVGVRANSDSFNPDFPQGHDNTGYQYLKGIGMLTSATSQSDKPNQKGPNLIPPTIDDSGEVSDTVSPNTVSSPITGRGFGVNLERHNPNRGPGVETFGGYLKRRRSDDGDIEIPKGEFVDEEKYDWEQ